MNAQSSTWIICVKPDKKVLMLPPWKIGPLGTIAAQFRRMEHEERDLSPYQEV
jgi:hypothetical protein